MERWLRVSLVICLISVLFICLRFKCPGDKDDDIIAGSSGETNLPSPWTSISSVNAPDARMGHTAVWTGTEMIIWGGIAPGPIYFNTGARYNPSLDTWTPITTTGAPAGRWNHTAIWTGEEMIIWGGNDTSKGWGWYNTGARYNPSLDTWTPITTTNAPISRTRHSVVWTGTEMLIWGGEDSITEFNTGARYNPSLDTWTPITTTGAPAARWGHAAVWTGSEMIISGGYLVASGARYNPTTDIWTPMAPGGQGGPTVYRDSTVWTGTEMIIWNYYQAGVRYNPTNNSWESMTTTNALTARDGHSVVWTGTEIIIWGGSDGYISYPNEVGKYNPVTDTWTLLSTTGVPDGRQAHTAIWTGTEMIIWGGGSGEAAHTMHNDGGRYKP